MEESKLRPCPFCDAQNPQIYIRGQGIRYVRCRYCGAEARFDFWDLRRGKNVRVSKEPKEGRKEGKDANNG
jgi:Zn ribbon nucleic-acid-binding protein